MALILLEARISRGSVIGSTLQRATSLQPASLLHLLARQFGQALEQLKQLISPFEADLRDDTLFVQRLQLGGMLQQGTAPRSEPERVGAPVQIGLAPLDESARLQIGDRRHEIRLLNTESGGHARLARSGILVDQHQHGKLAGAQVESAQGMVEVGKYDALRPAQGIAQVTAEWRQFHCSLSPCMHLPVPRRIYR